MDTTNIIVKRCKERQSICPRCQEPTRSMQCSKTEHPTSEEHEFPLGYGHLPPFGDGDCPNVFKKLTPNQISLLRESYVDYYMCQLLVEQELGYQWWKAFNPPELTEAQMLQGLFCSTHCVPCRIQEDPRTKDIIRMLFNEHVQKGKHPQFGYNLVDVMQELQEAWKAARA